MEIPDKVEKGKKLTQGKAFDIWEEFFEFGEKYPEIIGKLLFEEEFSLKEGKKFIKENEEFEGVSIKPLKVAKKFKEKFGSPEMEFDENGKPKWIKY